MFCKGKGFEEHAATFRGATKDFWSQFIIPSLRKGNIKLHSQTKDNVRNRLGSQLWSRGQFKSGEVWERNSALDLSSGTGLGVLKLGCDWTVSPVPEHGRSKLSRAP